MIKFEGKTDRNALKKVQVRVLGSVISDISDNEVKRLRREERQNETFRKRVTCLRCDRRFTATYAFNKVCHGCKKVIRSVDTSYC
jgi:hypothetical protein